MESPGCPSVERRLGEIVSEWHPLGDGGASDADLVRGDHVEPWYQAGAAGGHRPPLSRAGPRLSLMGGRGAVAWARLGCPVWP